MTSSKLGVLDDDGLGVEGKLGLAVPSDGLSALIFTARRVARVWRVGEDG